MSHADLKALGLSGGPSSNKIDPSKLFVIGLDGEGSNAAERIDWLKIVFPKLASRIDANVDPRADVPLDPAKLAAFRPKFAKAVVYESTGARFPDTGCGKWNGLPFLPVNTGRQTTKCMRATNDARRAEGSPTLDVVCVGRRFETDIERTESRVVENASILRRTPMQRAWDADRLHANGNGLALIDVAPLVDVTTEQGVRNLLDLLKCSDKVQAAVDAGPDCGGITQTLALQLAKLGDHDDQDAELARRLSAAEGKSGRERSQAIRGESAKQKPVRPEKISRVVERLESGEPADDGDVLAWASILRWAQGVESALDQCPQAFREAVISADKENATEKAKAKGKSDKRAKKEAA